MKYYGRKIKLLTKYLLLSLLIAGWIFSGWPRIWNNPPIPPKIQEAHAAVAFGAASESHTGTTGASDTFSWTHSGGVAPRADPGRRTNYKTA